MKLAIAQMVFGVFIVGSCVWTCFQTTSWLLLFIFPSFSIPFVMGWAVIGWGNKFNVDDYLRVIRGEELSMYDKNAAEVLERLPEGIMTRISRSPYPEGVIISGSSIKKEEKGTYSWVNVYKFESPEAVESADADEYFKGIKDDFKEAESVFAERGEPCPFRSFTLEQQREFVEWSVLIEEKYMIALLFYG